MNDTPQKVIEVHREGTDYQVLRATADEATADMMTCSSRQQLIGVLRGFGVGDPGLASIFIQLETSADAELRM